MAIRPNTINSDSDETCNKKEIDMMTVNETEVNALTPNVYR